MRKIWRLMTSVMQLKFIGNTNLTEGNNSKSDTVIVVGGYMNRLKRTICALLVVFLISGCRTEDKSKQTSSQPKNALEIVFTYGSEKENWIKDVTEKFNRENHKSTSGKPIFVNAIPMGSGECIDELLAGRRKAHLTSPASAAFIKLGNAQSRAKTGKDLIAATDNLVLSPVVIAMWEPMAKAIGWGSKPIGWSDILSLAKNAQGWSAYQHPEWGRFKFGHTHPEFSNSGLISVLAEVYAGSGKAANLSVADVENPKVGEYVSEIEKSVVHYGSSTGFFGRKMFENGPDYLSAAVLYENMIIESHSQTTLPVVAIYPKEGTFWSDHPVGIVERDWVTPEHRAAAKTYLQYLLDRPQQEKAMTYGFRPGVVEIPLAAPIDTDHGVDPREPKTTLEVPSVEVMDAVTRLWHEDKKHADVVLVFDTSGSMKDENKIASARTGSLQLLSMLGDEDTFSLLPFSSTSNWSIRSSVLKSTRPNVDQTLRSLFPSGGTALYDAIDSGYQYALQNQQPNRISAVVVLTDGADTDSKMNFQTLLQRIHFDNEKRTIRVFTIGYGSDAQKDILKQIADSTQAKFYEGTPDNIRSVFQEISTFF
ncbi:MAG: VWA domain-containing protein [Acidobacteria bacterium]|nr:MAG: VWA domain-containing protein [Acidobacteriota bacterium]